MRRGGLDVGEQMSTMGALMAILQSDVFDVLYGFAARFSSLEVDLKTRVWDYVAGGMKALSGVVGEMLNDPGSLDSVACRRGRNAIKMYSFLASWLLNQAAAEANSAQMTEVSGARLSSGNG